MKLAIICVVAIIATTVSSANVPCNKPCLGQYEVFQDCASVCPATCDAPYGNNCNACSPGCACMDGYVRNASYVCVKLCDCPGATTPIPM
ncbi:AAEL005098-PA [Aedes aegypti]|uniref:AAEL005098-PA n=1 Tax=Aedes aegypti TaxID=7159 RepID=Q17B34_AEDAE|nr:AAEL005098-PA [Aedes aegypti]